MSAAAATQSASPHAQMSINPSSYHPSSTLPPNEEGYYRSQGVAVPSNIAQSRQHRRQNGRGSSNNSPVAQQQQQQQQHYVGYSTGQQSRTAPLANQQATGSPNLTADLPVHIRNRSHAPDQFDGPAPFVPARTSSQQPSSSPATASRKPRQDITPNHTSNPAYPIEYDDPYRDRARDDTEGPAAPGSRSRRKGPGSPDGPHRATSARERNQQPIIPAQSRSEATMVSHSAPAPLVRENSEVINRVIISDPKVDAERLQERVAEAQPIPMSSDVSPSAGMASTGGDVAEIRGPHRRQDYSKSTSRRKDLQLGDYVLGQTLGEGEFGKVRLGWKKDGSSQVAIKLIRRETVANNPSRLPKINREISILRELAHPNIVRLHEMVETERHIGIILEYASGGELFDYILNNRYLKDPAARRLFAQLVSGVGYLHKKGIVHRDLKLENLLLDQNKNIIITDFGFANTFDPTDVLSEEIEYNLGNKEFVRKYRLDRQNERGMRKGDLMQTSCGSPCYAAPELVVSDSLYTGRKVDVWSCGVILYAMLAGYLPFDDDPANPEGDNINLLYKYITSTPLTFPEYVTPHARDLLRRILVPDPRKRADLFEVARHSWLSDYHHVVAHITSTTTNIADIVNTTLPDDSLDSPAINRSMSVREPKTTATVPKSSPNQMQMSSAQPQDDSARERATRTTRHTLQPEYVEPQTHTTRGTGVAAVTATAPTSRTRTDQGKNSATSPADSISKPLPQIPVLGSPSAEDYAAAQTRQRKVSPAGRTPRDIPRYVSDAPTTMATGPASTQPPVTYATRPSTGGSLTSATGPGGTRSDLRLPSRGSYGQPVAPTVATTNAQGRVTQPPKATRGYNISGPMPQHVGRNSIGQPMIQSASNDYSDSGVMPPPVQSGKGHHRRTSTLSGLGERLFGRSGSVARKRESDQPRQKNGRKYPPTSMKQSFPTEPNRTSVESKRSFSFGLGKKRSTDLESQTEKPGRRFSLLPASLSFRGLVGGNKDHVLEGESPQAGDFPLPPSGQDPSRPGTDNPHYAEKPSITGMSDQEEPRRIRATNFSRVPPAPTYDHQRYQPAVTQPTNDVYGGTGVYTSSQNASRGDTLPPSSFQPLYPDGFNDSAPRVSMQQGRPTRGVLTKPNRKFTDAYDNEPYTGSSGAVKKVQDFFRRRGRARADNEY